MGSWSIPRPGRRLRVLHDDPGAHQPLEGSRGEDPRGGPPGAWCPDLNRRITDGLEEDAAGAEASSSLVAGVALGRSLRDPEQPGGGFLRGGRNFPMGAVRDTTRQGPRRRGPEWPPTCSSLYVKGKR